MSNKWTLYGLLFVLSLIGLSIVSSDKVLAVSAWDNAFNTSTNWTIKNTDGTCSENVQSNWLTILKESETTANANGDTFADLWNSVDMATAGEFAVSTYKQPSGETWLIVNFELDKTHHLEAVNNGTAKVFRVSNNTQNKSWRIYFEKDGQGNCVKRTKSGASGGVVSTNPDGWGTGYRFEILGTNFDVVYPSGYNGNQAPGAPSIEDIDTPCDPLDLVCHMTKIFVPPDGGSFFDNIYTNLSTPLSEKLGFLTFPFEFFGSIAAIPIQASNLDCTGESYSAGCEIQAPGLLGGHNVGFRINALEEAFPALWDTLTAMARLGLVISIVMLLYNKYMHITAKGQSE